jgi:hypothetical protein
VDELPLVTILQANRLFARVRRLEALVMDVTLVISGRPGLSNLFVKSAVS